MPQDYNSLLNSVNFQNPSWDAFIFFFWAIVAVIYSFSAGRGRIISILVAVYMSELLVIQAPFLSTAVGDQFGLALYLGRLITFLVLFGFFFLVLSKFVFRTSVENRRWGSWVFSLFFAVLQVGFLISVILSFLPPEVKSSFAPLVKFVFISDTSNFIWLILPIAFLVFMGRHISDHRLE
ncbi:MAG: Uncharacterized protein G01um101477_273 [Candidatus Doudnabacteria bacterium Gr01-1014_77]|uniref:Uncharacterized protein n=1 Tax=Candidatus Doudnabacteria bacterium Gr01-1014_77 TaxID=2017133 RepID=A0A554JC45_9BACT|nr:MAG: Uncharacterized protein G01um101477_273 [Candidatus Doudnabacteria bacterium Gr01-1014_77]